MPAVFADARFAPHTFLGSLAASSASDAWRNHSDSTSFKRCGSADGEEPLDIHRFAAVRLRLEDDGDAAGVDPGGDGGDVEACELGSVKVFGGGPDRRHGRIVADVFEVLANDEVEVHPAPRRHAYAASRGVMM